MKTSLARWMGMAAMLALISCGTTRPETTAERDALQSDAEVALNNFRTTVADLDQLLKDAHGYVVFPSVAKGGALVGGARGQGVVYEQGELVGYARVTQATIGAQLGGQTLSQLIVFRDKATMEQFKADDYEPTAQATAVAATAGAAKSTMLEEGAAVLVISKAGLMAEAAVGGQRFDFVPRR